MSDPLPVKALSDVVIVVPTRNRASLAQAAIASVLEQSRPGVRILVSDNSTIREERQKLAAYCEARAEEALMYVRPPEPKPMPEHWQWALEAALELNASHYSYLTDRMLFKPGELANVVSVGGMYPDSVLAYNHDMVDDYAYPVRLYLHQWSGSVLRVQSSDVLGLCSRATFGNYIPRMLNCIVPRAVLDQIAGRFSTVFDSVAPDFCFAFRCLAVTDEFVYYDRSPLIHHALDRSNGAAYSRGIESPDSADFRANLSGAQPHSAAPIPELHGITNAILHEYCRVREEADDRRFPAVDEGLYLEAIARELSLLENHELRRSVEANLISAGWRPPARGRSARLAPARRLTAAPRFAGRFLKRVASRGLGSRAAVPLWSLLTRLRVPVSPPAILRFTSAPDAIRFAARYRRRPTREPVEVRPLLASPHTHSTTPSRRPVV